VWRGYPVESYYDPHWLTRLWSTQAKVEGIVLKAAWHWGHDPLGEPGCTPLYVDLPWTVTVCLPFFVRWLRNFGL